MQSPLTALADMARQAGSILKDRFHKDNAVYFKGDIDIVTEADRLSEEYLVSTITSRFPKHDILTEERILESKGSDYRWIIDPLDGTTNYSHHFPVFCVSLALEERGIVIAAAVYDPLRDELFTAERGRGASLNGRAIAVSRTADLSRALLATGFPYDIRTNPNNNINYFNVLALKVQAIRRAGSAALDLAYIAAGRFDGFWELRLRPWDTAAGWLLVEEAGGKTSDLNGKTFFINAPGMVASNGVLHNDILKIIDDINPLDDRLLTNQKG
ncbi:MAG: inositol monophosphatase [Deltaproteobacteria bacterium]|nr:inositol monophosphatase [Deltaproteobacteria bacterium]